jgi:MFS family permease
MAARFTTLVVLLLCVELLDELVSGVPSVGAPSIRETFGIGYGSTLGTLFVVPGAVALVVEPVLFVLADRYPRRWFVCGGLGAMALASAAAALAPSAATLSVAIAASWVGSGSGVALSQATLADTDPANRERLLARWGLFGELGDLAAPALLAGLAALGLGWRAAFGIGAALTLAAAVALWTRPFPERETDDTLEEVGLWTGLREALKHRRLLLWLGAAALCDLLDEVLVVFAALFLDDRLGFDEASRSLVIAAGVVGAIVGALLTDRLLRRTPPLRLLAATSALSVVAYLGWLAAPTVWASALAFGFVGATVAPMYPIASAQAYATLPGRSGTVHAAGHVYTPLTLALPFALGALADATNVRWALLVLLAQPVGLGLLALFARAPRDA